ncbi:MAG: Grx4 family monothiol glutaredoxin [Sandaracinaceae bacterium]
MDEALKSRLQSLVDDNDVVLFMKGTKHFPQCGFSATVVEVLRRLDIKDYRDVNVLEDPEVRQGVKEFSNWPTIPQLYVKGSFIGGCDIVRDMYTSGELEPTLRKALGTDAAPDEADSTS